MALNNGTDRKYGLFEVIGVELEYMIADADTLSVKPISDRVFHDVTGSYETDFINGEIEWSNELALHLIELKTSLPSADLSLLPQAFCSNVKRINDILSAHNAILMPTSMHPLMNPGRELVLWPHECSEIYELYDRVFDCRSHGWANLQSMHLNLPFKDDDEFGRLHASVRVLLPVIAAISASSPIIEGRYSGYVDTRLREYVAHQGKIPVLGGSIIPEGVYTEHDYDEKILEPINSAFKPHDPRSIMSPLFLNSRGAIARFDRGALEIRIIDVQECPAADIAIASVIIEVLKNLVDQKWSDTALQKSWHERRLFDVFSSVIKDGDDAVLTDREYLKIFNIDRPGIIASSFWRLLYERITHQLNSDTQKNFETILGKGTLSKRIRRSLGEALNPDTIKRTYRRVCDCLVSNEMFL